MKKICLTITIALFLLINLNGLQAQTTQPELNHVELMKQLVGMWKSDAFNDTILTAEYKSFGNGLVCSSSTTLKGKIIREANEFIGYDEKNGKLLDCSIYTSDKNITMYSMWFTSPNKYTVFKLQDWSKPDSACYMSNYEFKSSDLLVQTDINNYKTIGIYTFHRVK